MVRGQRGRTKSEGRSRGSGASAVRGRTRAGAASVLGSLAGLFALAATATTTTTLSLAWQGETLQLGEVHARQADGGLQVLMSFFGGGLVAASLGVGGQELVDLAS